MTRLISSPSSQTPKLDFDLSPSQRFSAFIVSLEIIHGDSVGNLTATRWSLVSQRDPSANSSFFYGVTSTRIFCRPTCPGRVARRSNVIYFDTQSHALQSGYRPCRRCEPCNDDWSRDYLCQNVLQRVRDMIVAAEADGTPWTVGSFARKLNVGPAHLHRQFKKFYATTPKSFATSLRMAAPTGNSSASSGSMPIPSKVPITTPLMEYRAPTDSTLDFDVDWAIGMDENMVAGEDNDSSVYSTLETGLTFDIEAEGPINDHDALCGLDQLPLLDMDGIHYNGMQ